MRDDVSSNAPFTICAVRPSDPLLPGLKPLMPSSPSESPSPVPSSSNEIRSAIVCALGESVIYSTEPSPWVTFNEAFVPKGRPAPPFNVSIRVANDSSPPVKPLALIISFPEVPRSWKSSNAPWLTCCVVPVAKAKLASASVKDAPVAVKRS